MGVIYKITNKINHKIYIGQTRVTEPQRWQQHVWYANNCPNRDSLLLCYAIRKYGKENFQREIIEECDNDLLNKREIYWINYYNSTDKNVGYNLTLGGEACSKYSDKEILTAFEQEKSVTRASRAIGMNRNAFSRRLQAMGYTTTREVPIEQYSLQGELLNIYSNATVAAEETGVNFHSITSSNTITSGGYIWRRVNEIETIEDLVNKLSRNIPALQGIEQYDTNGNLLAIFDSAGHASKETGINISSIKAAGDGKQASAGGYLWRRIYKGLDYTIMLNNYLLSSSCCQIEEIDNEENIIQTFESATKAEKLLGWSYNSIKKVCDGKAKHTHNRYFRYSNPLKRKLLNERNG